MNIVENQSLGCCDVETLCGNLHRLPKELSNIVLNEYINAPFIIKMMDTERSIIINGLIICAAREGNVYTGTQLERCDKDMLIEMACKTKNMSKWIEYVYRNKKTVASINVNDIITYTNGRTFCYKLVTKISNKSIRVVTINIKHIEPWLDVVTGYNFTRILIKCSASAVISRKELERMYYINNNRRPNICFLNVSGVPKKLTYYNIHDEHVVVHV
jgi:hypothetical protein